MTNPTCRKSAPIGARLTGGQLDAARHALLHDQADELLRLMRAAHFGRTYQPGSITRDELFALARSAGWLADETREVPRLTDLGRKIADVAREYCNWLDDGRGLPHPLTADDVAGRRVLDVGCGFGRYLFALEAAGARAVGVDLDEGYLQLSEVMARKAGASLPKRVRAPGQTLPFADASFDMVMCLRALSYMPIAPAIQEFARVLAPRGQLLLVTGTLVIVTRELGAALRSPLNGWRKVPRLVIECLEGLAAGRGLGPLRRGSGSSTTAHSTHVSRRSLLRICRNAGLQLLRMEPRHETYLFEKL